MSCRNMLVHCDDEITPGPQDVLDGYLAERTRATRDVSPLLAFH